jgi:hypothetical protein
MKRDSQGTAGKETQTCGLLNYSRASASGWSRQAALRLIKHDAPAVSDLPKVIVKIVAKKNAAGKTALAGVSS